MRAFRSWVVGMALIRTYVMCDWAGGSRQTTAAQRPQSFAHRIIYD